MERVFLNNLMKCSLCRLPVYKQNTILKFQISESKLVILFS
jgi:hypothetical protein